MAKKDKSVTQLLPELLTKAIGYFDNQIEKTANSKQNAIVPENIDQAYLMRLQNNLPVIAKSMTPKPSPDTIRRKSYVEDLQATLADQGYKDRGWHLSFETLNRMAMRDSIVSSILVTRVNQISNFARPEKDHYKTGFQVVKKDKTAEVSKEDLEKSHKLEQWVLNCGYEEDRLPEERMNFEEFLRRIIPDRLTYDAVTVEIIPCEDGTPHHFLPVSSGTIRFASKNYRSFPSLMVTQNAYGLEYYERPDDLIPDPDMIKYIQLYQGMMIEGFSEDEMIYRQGNPTNDPTYNGYSIPELERLIGIVASHIYAETHNKQFFAGGFTASGVLHFKGDIPQEQMDGFRRAWETQVTGANNSFRTPIIATEEDVNWLPISISNKDMEWSNWVNYLIKITCGIFQIDPSEINFWDLSQGSGSSMNEGNRNETIIKQSKDKGLRPLLRFIESIINDDIFKKLGPEVSEHYEFKFVGLEAEERDEEVARHEKEVKTIKSVNQVRKEAGLRPLPYMDNMILDPVYFQWYQQYSPEAAELKIKNQVMERLLYKKYEDKVSGVLGDDLDLGGFDVDEEVENPDAKEKKPAKEKEKINKSVRVEYFDL